MEGKLMNKEDMILISVDDHIVEPPDLFENHLPTKYQDDAPRLVHNDDGSDVWMFRDTVIPNIGAQRGRRPAQGGVRHRADRASTRCGRAATTSTSGSRT